MLEIYHEIRGNLVISTANVHVWYVSLDQPPSPLGILAQTLSEDERSRANTFVFDQHRRRFIAGRGLLRTILGSYSGIAPNVLHFCYGPHGKPALERTGDGSPLYFNLSHSQGLAVVAITRCGEIGVDVERYRCIHAVDQIAERLFSPEERAALRALPSDQKQQAFFNCWTRKEAYVKASGGGLSQRLDQFSVSVIPGEPAALLSIEGDSHGTKLCSVHALAPPNGYVAALAVKGHAGVSHTGRWNKSTGL